MQSAKKRGRESTGAVAYDGTGVVLGCLVALAGGLLFTSGVVKGGLVSLAPWVVLVATVVVVSLLVGCLPKVQFKDGLLRRTSVLGTTVEIELSEATGIEAEHYGGLYAVSSPSERIRLPLGWPGAKKLLTEVCRAFVACQYDGRDLKRWTVSLDSSFENLFRGARAYPERIEFEVAGITVIDPNGARELEASRIRDVRYANLGGPRGGRKGLVIVAGDPEEYVMIPRDLVSQPLPLIRAVLTRLYGTP
ncbi:MAG: hypothetical protein GY851_10305 [bacterium]|nr:hypothetical protein [bacterium]